MRVHKQSELKMKALEEIRANGNIRSVDLAENLKIGLPNAQMTLFRIWRQKLAERSRPAVRTYYSYSLTDRGEKRLDWLNTHPKELTK